MVTERVRTLPTEPTEGDIVKSRPLVSFINIGQRGRKYGIPWYIFSIRARLGGPRTKFAQHMTRRWETNPRPSGLKSNPLPTLPLVSMGERERERVGWVGWLSPTLLPHTCPRQE